MTATVTLQGSFTHWQITDTFRETLLDNLKNKEEQSEGLVLIFAELESAHLDVANNANKTLEFLMGQNFNLHQLVLRSLPLWPINAPAIQKIVLEQSESKNPIVRERAKMACSYLVTNGYKEGFATAALVASKKLRSSDEKIQQEGLAYFNMLLEQYRPYLCADDLSIAIDVASKMFASEQKEVWLPANTFFKQLISNGNTDDILKIKKFILEACASGKSLAYQLCDTIVTKHHNQADLIAIAIEAASNGCAPEKLYNRGAAFSLFWRLLSWAPENSIEPLIQGILIESRRKDPCIEILGRLQEVVGHDFSNLMCSSGRVVKSRWREDAPRLMEALTNLSSCKSTYFSETAKELKKTLEDRLKG